MKTFLFKKLIPLFTFLSLSFLLPQSSIAAPPPGNWTIYKSGVVDLTIMGHPIATQRQCLKYLLRQNPLPLISVPAAELIKLFYEEAGREGVRPDLAFAQSLHETGNFRYGGDVIPIQNNYCGLGTTGNKVKGAFFPSARIGVRAQIQHLMAYATKKHPSLPLVDPRYNLVRYGRNFASCPTWISLNGKWAVPGKTYGQMILGIHQKILRE
ncbi:MAG: glucosaminidase domain-containing protein [Sporomusaceae bacterium]|jgi:hypothetical protein|nr:glucosaminidase domain-containing protein [Sporomusaceae bacterium]